MTFAYAHLIQPNLPPALGRWGGFPKYHFIGGNGAPEKVPTEALIAATKSVLERDGTHLATYGMQSGPQGYLPLRDFISQSVNKRTGQTSTPDDVLVLTGSLQALEFINATLTAPGDTVLVEEATYGGALARLRRAGLTYVGMPMDNDGIRPDALDETLTRLKAEGTQAKYLYTIPTVQNPTGTVMPEARRLEILKVAQKHGVPIFEDDCYAELTWDGERPKSFRALDNGGGHVIYCGSFSKTIAPALRVGYLIADQEVLLQMAALKTDGGTGALDQMVLAEFCAKHFDSHVKDLTARFKEKCDTIMEALSAEFGTTAEFVEPKGGIFIWVRLPESVDTSKLAVAAAKEGVIINAGADWVADPATGKQSLRLCFGNPTLENIKEGIAKLAEVCHQEFGVPVRGGNVARG